MSKLTDEELKARNAAYKRKWAEKNKDKAAASKRAWKERNKEQNKAINKQYRENNKEHCSQYKKEYHQKNRESISAKGKQYYLDNLERERQRSRDYYKANRETEITRTTKWANDMYKTDPVYALVRQMRSCIRSAYIRTDTSRVNVNYVEILGCTDEEFYDHINETCYRIYGAGIQELLDNDYKVTLDHIIPVSTAKTPEEVLQLNHWSNFQGLIMTDNAAKSASLDPKWLPKFYTYLFKGE